MDYYSMGYLLLSDLTTTKTKQYCRYSNIIQSTCIILYTEKSSADIEYLSGIL